MQIGQKESPTMQGRGSDLNKKLSAKLRKKPKIEVKIGSDRQSETQKKFQQAVEQAGGIYIITQTFEQSDWYSKILGRNGLCK